MDQLTNAPVKTVKLATIDAMFPELKGKLIYVIGRGTGSTAKVAIARAASNLIKQVRGRRWTTIKATITVIDTEAK